MRLIDADALIRDVYESKRTFIGPPDKVYFNGMICEDVVSWVENANTVDAVPVVHGHWNMMPDYIGEMLTLERRICSECGYSGYHGDYKYCPYCGATMDGENDEIN